MRRNLKGVRSEKTEESEKEKCLMKIEFSVQKCCCQNFCGEEKYNSERGDALCEGDDAGRRC